MIEDAECVVIGAGVVGLAIAKRLAEDGRAVAVVEKESKIGKHASSRNSEVIHAGLYYPTGSLRASLCIDGRNRLYQYCEQRNIAQRRIGKLIVAKSVDELGRLREIRQLATNNGVTDLRWLSEKDLQVLEPQIAGQAGLLSPSTGIVDSHGLMMAMVADIEANNGTVLLHNEVTNIEATADGFVLTILRQSNESVRCNVLINAAGLFAQNVSRITADFPAALIPQQHLAIGHYFSYDGDSPFNRLIYPLPSNGGLGIHATLDLAGSIRFGPNLRWVDAINYDFDVTCKREFCQAIETYYPAIDAARLQPAYTGIRPKLSGAQMPAVDFKIQGRREHGMPGLINLYGIDSPGLTSSLAIAEHVQKLLAESEKQITPAPPAL